MIMLSGGTESTALIKHALKKNLKPLCVYVVASNNQDVHRDNVKAICDYYNVNLHVVDLQNNMSADYGYNRNQYTWWAIGGCIALGLAPDIKSVWVGGNCGIHINGDEVSEANAYSLAARSMQLMDAAFQLVGTKGMAWQPLSTLTKIQLWNMIDKDVRHLLTTCEKQQTKQEGACGKCKKCLEYASLENPHVYSKITKQR